MTFYPRLSYCSPKINGFKGIIFILGCIISLCSQRRSHPRARVCRASPYAWRSGLAQAGGAGALDAAPEVGLALAAI